MKCKDCAKPNNPRQLKTIGIPSQVQANQAVQSGGMIYVQPYTRADGTSVKGYYRSVR